MKNNNIDENIKKKEEERKRWRTLRRIIEIIIIIILILLLLRQCSGPEYVIEDEGKPRINWDIDDNAEKGPREEKSQEEIQEELNKKVEEGMMNISMNASPAFNDGRSEGNLLIVNNNINRYPQMVEIYRKDTNELIYQSKLVPVGYRLDNAKLDVVLPKGVYECIAYFNAVDTESNAIVGKAGAEIVITILN